MTTLRIHEISVRVFHFPAFCEPNAQYGLTVEDGYRGAFNWDVGGGILLDRWGNGISKSIDVRRGGGFSSVSGGQIYLDNNTGLYDFLQKNNLNLEGCRIEIRFAGVRLMTGVVTGIERGVSDVTILYDDPSAHRNAIISARKTNGDFASAVFGEKVRAKFSSLGVVTEDAMGFEFELDSETLFSGNNGRLILFHVHETNTEALDAASAVAQAINVRDGNYYAYCVHGDGKGVAIRIENAYVFPRGEVGFGMWVIAFTLAEYVNVTAESHTEFFPVTRYYEESSETPEPIDYNRISVFKIYKVSVEFNSDLWQFSAHPSFNSFYVYENDN